MPTGWPPSAVTGSPFPGGFAFDGADVQTVMPGLVELGFQRAPDTAQDRNAFGLASVRCDLGHPASFVMLVRSSDGTRWPVGVCDTPHEPTVGNASRARFLPFYPWYSNDYARPA